MPTFDGDNLTITLDSGVTSVDVIDHIYEPWKDWMLLSHQNRKYPQAFRSDGGNPLSAIINQGSYIFLNNAAGWRIKAPEEDITIYLTGNLAVEDTSLPAFIPTTGAYTAAILGLQPVTQGVTESMKTALEQIAFNEGVAIHEVDGYAGTGYAPDGTPIGTRSNPSNNTADADTIAHSRGLNKYYIMSSMSLGTGDGFGGEDHQVIGDSPINTTLTVAAAADVSNCDFRNMTLVGAFDSGFIARECVLGNMTGLNGHAYSCSLKGPLQLAEDISIQGCWTQPDDGFEVVDIDFNSQAVDCDISGQQGGRLVVKNMTTGSSMYITGHGEVEIHSSCTGGILRAYADIRVINNGTLDTLDDQTTANTVWDKPKALTTGKFIGLK